MSGPNVSRGDLPAALGDVARRLRVLERLYRPIIDPVVFELPWAMTPDGAVPDVGGSVDFSDTSHLMISDADVFEHADGSGAYSGVTGIAIKEYGCYLAFTAANLKTDDGVDHSADGDYWVQVYVGTTPGVDGTQFPIKGRSLGYHSGGRTYYTALNALLINCDTETLPVAVNAVVEYEGETTLNMDAATPLAVVRIGAAV